MPVCEMPRRQRCAHVRAQVVDGQVRSIGLKKDCDHLIAKLKGLACARFDVTDVADCFKFWHHFFSISILSFIFQRGLDQLLAVLSLGLDFCKELIARKVTAVLVKGDCPIA